MKSDGYKKLFNVIKRDIKPNQLRICKEDQTSKEKNKELNKKKVNMIEWDVNIN